MLASALRETVARPDATTVPLPDDRDQRQIEQARRAVVGTRGAQSLPDMIMQAIDFSTRGHRWSLGRDPELGTTTRRRRRTR